MIPIIISPTELRKNLATYLNGADKGPVVVTGQRSNKIILDEREYNRLSALANQFSLEDPEGEYRPAFIKEMLSRSKDGDFVPAGQFLSDLL